MQNLKTSSIHAAGIVLLSGFIVSGYFLGIRPAVQGHETKLRIAENAAKLKRIAPQLARENRKLAQQIEQTEEELASKYLMPTSRDKPILEVVSELLGNRNLELINFREEPTSILEVKVEIQLTGTYQDFAHLLHDLRKLDRPNRISSMVLQTRDELGEDCSARIKVEFSQAPKLANT